MWTSIRFRSRTALTVIAIVLTAAIVVAATLFAIQRVWPGQMHTYQSYTIDVAPSAPWHPGESLSLHWTPSVTQIGSTSHPIRSHAPFGSTVLMPRKPPRKPD